MHTLSMLQKEFGLDKSNILKTLKKHGIELFDVRMPEANNQQVKCVDKEGYEAFKELRQGFHHPKKKKIATGGIFYFVRLMPEMPHRIKAGYTSDFKSRMMAHKTCCPQLEVLKTWPCKKTWESMCLDVIKSNADKIIGPEVFEISDVKAVLEKLENLFELVQK